MDTSQVIKRPLITEKSTFQTGELNRYGFQVDKHATKPEIKKAVEELYGVRVMSVATNTRKGQLRRNKYGFWKSKDMKRAIVKVHPEDKIELF